MPPPFPNWILRGLGDEPLLVQPFDAPRPPEYVILPPMFVIGYLGRWLHEPDARRVLIDIYGTLFGALDLAPWAHDEVYERIGPPLRTAFERMDLIVLTPRRRNAPPPLKQRDPTVPPPPPPAKEKTWVEIELFEGKKPVAGERYAITPPGGARVPGTLDAEGFARLEGIDPGTCKVEFPDIDAREWGFQVVFSSSELASGDVISTEPDENHTVLQGEDMFIIAKANKFRNWQTVYRYDANESFCVLRPKPQILFPDSLVIPGKKRKVERVSTGATHKFYVHPPTRKLRLHLLDEARKPIAGKPYQLFVDGSLLEANQSTGGQGEIDEEIPLDAQSGSVVTDDFTWPLAIASLNPVDKTNDQGVSGAQGRLKNLGYDVGPIDGILGPRTAKALRQFQAEHPGQGVVVNGQLDQATKNALVSIHGC